MSEGENELPDLLPERRKPRPLWVRLLCVAGALVLFAAGIVGWLVPVVTGIPFYVAGVVLLAAASNRAREWVNRLERRFPHGFRLKLRSGMRKVGVKPPSREGAASPSGKEASEDRVPGGV